MFDRGNIRFLRRSLSYGIRLVGKQKQKLPDSSRTHISHKNRVALHAKCTNRYRIPPINLLRSPTDRTYKIIFQGRSKLIQKLITTAVCMWSVITIRFILRQTKYSISQIQIQKFLFSFILSSFLFCLLFSFLSLFLYISCCFAFPYIFINFLAFFKYDKHLYQ